MKKIVTIAVAVAGLVLGSTRTQAQTKIGYISLQELIISMPEAKKADTALNDYQIALGQSFEDLKREYYEQDSLLNSKDSLKYTTAQKELKKKSLTDLMIKLQGFQQQSQQLYQQKQQDLLGPIERKAMDAVNAVAKENGYAYVLRKEALLTTPPADDLLPLVKKKLGIK